MCPDPMSKTALRRLVRASGRWPRNARIQARAGRQWSLWVGAGRLDPAQDSRELLDVSLAEPLKKLRADGREVGGGGFEQAVAAGLRGRDPGGARVGGIALALYEALAFELDREP